MSTSVPARVLAVCSLSWGCMVGVDFVCLILWMSEIETIETEPPMQRRYDPMRAPRPLEWLALDEMERMELVLRYHRRAGVDLPNERLHALFHVVIENQAALGDETPVAATLERLCSEGLDRHEAIHAVGSVLANHIWTSFHGTEQAPEAYHDEVRKLTAQQWLSSSDE